MITSSLEYLLYPDCKNKNLLNSLLIYFVKIIKISNKQMLPI